MIHGALRDERSGPFVWTGIIGVTCLLLVLLEHMLWLVLPFILGTVMYYILLGPMQRLLRAGFTRNVSATLVCIVFYGATVLLVMATIAAPTSRCAGPDWVPHRACNPPSATQTLYCRRQASA